MNQKIGIASLLCLALHIIVLPVARAQKIPLESDNSRIVQLHDVGDLVRASGEQTLPGVQILSSPAEVEEHERDQLERMADFARTFMQPPLDGEDDIQPLGRSYLVALARPEQQAWLEDLIRRQREAGDHQMLLEVQQLTLSDAQYQKLFQPLLSRIEANPVPDSALAKFFLQRHGGATTTAFGVLSKEDADALMVNISQAQIDQLMAPRVLTRPMGHVEMQVGETIQYVRDFRVVRNAGTVTAIPINDEIFHGLKISASCGLVGSDLIGLTLSIEMTAAEIPIPTFTTEIEEGVEVTMELPTLRIDRLEQKVVLADGGTGLFAVQRESGIHTVFLATVTKRN